MIGAELVAVLKEDLVRLTWKQERENVRYRKLGASGIDASVVGVGAWAIGGWMWGGADEAESIGAIHAALDAGINLIDTAPMYGFGRSEEVVGKAIRGRRDDVVLATKCGLVWHTEEGELSFTSDENGPNAEGHIKVNKCLSPESIRYEVELSLRRLGTDHIDLYQTHWQTATTPIADTMATLMALKDEGKIRAIGCSNADAEQMDAYRAAGQLDVDQEKFSMLARRHEQDDLPYCAAHNIAFLAYSPLCAGLLTGKIGPDRKFGEGDKRLGNPQFSMENRQKVLGMLDTFRPIAERHGVSLGQLVIAWTIAQPGCSHALVGARNAEQAMENAKAGDVQLTDAELQAMRDAIEQHADGIQ
jgi:methylglyoxal reductase